MRKLLYGTSAVNSPLRSFLIVNEIKNLANDRDITLKELARKIGGAQQKQFNV